jgi:hypothetical protein
LDKLLDAGDQVKASAAQKQLIEAAKILKVCKELVEDTQEAKKAAKRAAKETPIAAEEDADSDA